MKSIVEILQNAKKAYVKCMCSSITQSVPCSNLGEMVGMRPIDVIREAKDIYVSGSVSGMCESFEWAIGSDWNLYLKNNIPLFCYNVAVQKFGATGHPDNYWWSLEDRYVRIKYFDWLIKMYKKERVSCVDMDYYPVV